jgi:uncharacterized lipoprotein
MRRFNRSKVAVLLAIAAVIAAGCSAHEEPATPVETFQTYVKAMKKKDLTTMKLLLSKDTIKMHEQEAKAEGVTLDDVVKRETLLGQDQSTVEYRNEKIDGDHATLEYKNSYGAWETIPFIKEDNEWKIDKKGYADQLQRDVEQNSQQFDEMLNRGRQP